MKLNLFVQKVAQGDKHHVAVVLVLEVLMRDVFHALELHLVLGGDLTVPEFRTQLHHDSSQVKGHRNF